MTETTKKRDEAAPEEGTFGSTNAPTQGDGYLTFGSTTKKEETDGDSK